MNILALDPATKCGVIRFTVLGTARPQGNKRRMPNGCMIELATLKPWRSAVAYEALAAYRGEKLEGPIAMRLRFYVPRPKDHVGKRGLKPSAPPHPHARSGGDVDKLARAIFDALAGIIYRNDKQVVKLDAAVEYGDPERVEIEVTEYQEPSK